MIDPIYSLKARLKNYRALKDVSDELNGLARLAVKSKLREIVDQMLLEVIVYEALLNQKQSSDLLKQNFPLFAKELKEVREGVIDFMKDLD